MRIREPREGWILGLCLWGALFGGIPMVILVGAVRGNGELPPVLFVALFPVIAAVVVGLALRRWFRSGFTVTTDGLRGAHDAEGRTVPWEEVQRFEWRDVGPTSDVRVNDRPLPSGPALFAVLDDGRALRVMQACAPRAGQRRRIHRQLDEAYEQGIVPVHLDRRVHPGHGPGSGDVGPGRDAGVTRWSSTGHGEAVPPADDGDDLRWPGG